MYIYTYIHIKSYKYSRYKDTRKYNKYEYEHKYKDWYKIYDVWCMLYDV